MKNSEANKLTIISDISEKKNTLIDIVITVPKVIIFSKICDYFKVFFETKDGTTKSN